MAPSLIAVVRVVGGMGTGVALMYLADPGRGRRGLLRIGRNGIRRVRELARVAHRRARGVVRGPMAAIVDAITLLWRRPALDELIATRARARLRATSSHPKPAVATAA